MSRRQGGADDEDDAPDRVITPALRTVAALVGTAVGLFTFLNGAPWPNRALVESEIRHLQETNAELKADVTRLRRQVDALTHSTLVMLEREHALAQKAGIAFPPLDGPLFRLRDGLGPQQ